VKLKKDQFNPSQNPGGASSSMEITSERLSQEYREYQQSFNSSPLSKRFDTKKYDEERKSKMEQVKSPKDLIINLEDFDRC
jgi:hypothetical protein